jgi:hypothetical protein
VTFGQVQRMPLQEAGSLRPRTATCGEGGSRSPPKTTDPEASPQAPARALLLHEGMRSYHESSLDEGFHEFIENHAPLLKQLARINNLAYGLSPGRFFLEGIADKRTDQGKVMQALASVFVPSGAATPLATAVGGLGDLAVNAFTPVVVTGESIDRAGGVDGLVGILERYIPLVRDTEQYVEAVRDQSIASFEGAAPEYQFQEYVEGVKDIDRDLEPFATALGYSSVDGLLASNLAPLFKDQREADRIALADRFPTGFQMAQRFENDDALSSRALLELARKPDRVTGRGPHPGRGREHRTLAGHRGADRAPALAHQCLLIATFTTSVDREARACLG